MTVSDYLALLRIVGAYDLRPRVDDVLAAAHRISDRDLAEVSDILTRVPCSKASRFARDPGFGPALDRLAGTAPDPRNRAVAFFKVGVPVRGLVLPACIRDMIAVRVRVGHGRLLVNGVAVDLRGMSQAQRRALEHALASGDVRTEAASRATT